MNLIEDQWIPVRTRANRKRWIAPWQITEGLDDDPIVAIDAPRADFTGALMQFLIGLLQTAFAPERERDWPQEFEQPPSPQTLKDAFAQYRDVFYFGPDRPSFMEDIDLQGTADKPISGLLIEAPGGNTLKENKDFFIKRGTTEKICPEIAAMALLTLQINAPSGGVGHRTSLRGGGPLSTLVVNTPKSQFDTLWHNLWLNVLDQVTFNRLSGASDLTNLLSKFPWMGAARTSEKGGVNTTPEHAHPLTMFWAAPRRVALDWGNAQSGVCDITGKQSETLISGYVTQNYGANYEGAWLHPLSPYRENEGSEPSPLHPQPGGISYRHWLGFTVNKPEHSRPAAVVAAWAERRRSIDALAKSTPYIWAFGYDMDNMKARCWYESLMPLHYVQNDPARFAEHVGMLVEAANLTGSYLRTALKQAWFKRPKDARGDVSFISDAFWQTTEAAFYRHVKDLARLIDEPEQTDETLDLALRDVAQSWLVALRGECLRLFNQWVATGYFEAEDPRRASVAHNDLQKKIHGKTLRAALGLPVSKKAA